VVTMVIDFNFCSLKKKLLGFSIPNLQSEKIEFPTNKIIVVLTTTYTHCNRTVHVSCHVSHVRDSDNNNQSSNPIAGA
jgi:hypothetical protein